LSLTILADCDAFRELPTNYAGATLCRQPTGSVLLTQAESSNFDLCLVIEQRGLEDEAEIARFVEGIVRSRKLVETYLDPRKPLPKAAQAQRLVYQAQRANGRQRAKLAKRALALWPDCADAYLLLSQAADTDSESIDLLLAGLEAGERALRAEYQGEEIERLLRRAADAPEPLSDERPLSRAELEAAAEEYEVEFWAQQPTRPYMRVRSELAQALWDREKTNDEQEADDRKAALGHLRALLRLCPRDFQGNRYLMAGCLLDASLLDASLLDASLLDASLPDTAEHNHRSLAELGALLERYAMDHSTHWLYTKALWLFKQDEGQEKDQKADETAGSKAANQNLAQAALHQAIEANPFVPALLAGLEQPCSDFSSFAPGSLEEAHDYLELAAGAWLDDEEAVSWMVAAFLRGVKGAKR
jgi:hypothetical protein